MQRSASWAFLTAALGGAMAVGTVLTPALPAVRLAPEAVSNEGRTEYFDLMLRDPATGRIPDNIRALELAHARTLPVNDGLSKTGVPLFTWTEAGPNDVGGRTRALAYDAGNPATILAAGVSGGIWKSTNGGASWRLVTSAAEGVGFTALAQDPRPGFRNYWYAAGGEYTGGSQSGRGGTANIYGSGLYRSTNGGDTWTLVQDAGGVITFDTMFDFVSRVAVNPATGSVWTASNALGLYKSSDNGLTFPPIDAPTLGGINHHTFSDLTFAPNGRLLAVLGAPSSASTTPSNTPGVYVSDDDGASFRMVGVGVVPENIYRAVVAISPSNPNVGYVFYITRASVHGLAVLDLATGGATDRSASLPPNFTNRFGGTFTTQGGYDMVLTVKPNDPNFVVLGGTNLYRTRDGFATKISSLNDWIGGYDAAGTSDDGQYPNHHPDQHVAVWHPAAPSRLLAGHDGGLSETADVTASPVTWTERNTGYNVTQFYTVAQPLGTTDRRIAGGAQDNGTPLLMAPGDPYTAGDISSGDGAYVSFLDGGSNTIYASSQNGRVLRLSFNVSGDALIGYAVATPRGATGQLFVNPYVIDPNNEEVMYYPAGDTLWRNNALSSIPESNGTPTTIGWTKTLLTGGGTGSRITALDVSRSAPFSRLYYGVFRSGSAPRLYRVDNAQGATDGETLLTLPNAPTGSYIHDISVNPSNADEVLVVLSNYNIRGLYHTRDGGTTWTVVEGNLEGSAATPGPSLRSAQILPYGGKTVYLVGTSTGLYATTSLFGDATVWERQHPDGLGAFVVEDVAARRSDGRVLAGTHGRGIFVGMPGEALPTDERTLAASAVRLDAPQPNPSRGATRVAFALDQPAAVRLRVFDLLGRAVATPHFDTRFVAGRHEAAFDTRAWAPGTYIVRLEAASDAGARAARTQRLVVQ